VLVVEDEGAVRDLAVRVLRTHGYRVLEALNGVDALRVADDYHGDIQLVLADVVMPQMGGLVLAERLAANRPTVRILFMSGYADSEIVQPRWRHREIAFIDKPFTPAQLVRKVRAVLDSGERLAVHTVSGR
jgi:two-component system cell cycle sensor histidine kinase/response regulator CckA